MGKLEDFPMGTNMMTPFQTSWHLRPRVLLPRTFKDFGPEWANCEGLVIGIYDPPRALNPAPAMVNPTQSPLMKHLGPPARPASMPGDAATVPTQTSRPKSIQ